MQIPGIGSAANGAQRLVRVPAASRSRPSEFAKIGLILMLAAMLSELRTPEPMLPDVLRVCIVSAVTDAAWSSSSADIGTTIVLVAIVVGILVVAGTRPRHLVALALAPSC